MFKVGNRRGCPTIRDAVTSSEKAQRVAEIVEEALEHDAADWPSFLDEACADDLPLRREVESLLGYSKAATDFIEAPAYESAAADLAAEEGELKPGALL